MFRDGYAPNQKTFCGKGIKQLAKRWKNVEANGNYFEGYRVKQVSFQYSIFLKNQSRSYLNHLV